MLEFGARSAAGIKNWDIIIEKGDVSDPHLRGGEKAPLRVSLFLS